VFTDWKQDEGISASGLVPIVIEQTVGMVLNYLTCQTLASAYSITALYSLVGRKPYIYSFRTYRVEGNARMISSVGYFESE
jgi:hypothetical protein